MFICSMLVSWLAHLICVLLKIVLPFPLVFGLSAGAWFGNYTWIIWLLLSDWLSSIRGSLGLAWNQDLLDLANS